MPCPTPADRLLDPRGRPYFLWDCAWTDGEFRTLLASGDPDARGILLGKLMRQAKPDDVFLYTTEAEIRACWDRILPLLGATREFWGWILGVWEAEDAR